ncbi:hypothetical protein RB595_000909 [Gaeumannomyces hyphopodioides]
MRFTFPAPVRDDDRDDYDDEARPISKDTSSSHTPHADAGQSVSGQTPPATASCGQRDEAEARRAILLARLQQSSITDADWDNATSSSSSSDDESEDDGLDSHRVTDHAARLTGLQGSVEANRDAPTTTSTTPTAVLSAQAAPSSVTKRQQPQLPDGRGHDPTQASGKWKSEPLQNPRRATTGDSWVLLGCGKIRPLGPGAPGLTVTRPDGAVFVLRPPENSRDDGGDDVPLMTS